MKIESLAVDKINPAIYNPRKDLKPGDPEYDKLKKSILEFDMVEPLVWNKKTGNLVGGHQRLKILKELGIKNVEVSVVNLSEVKEKALNLALNKISGEWDYPKLKDLLEELDTGDFDIEITGFDPSEIEDLMTQFHTPEEGLTDDDEIPEKVETICKAGDLWELGNHRLLCGDATVEADVAKLMANEKAILMATDPPYGDSWIAKARDMQKHGYGHSRAGLHGSMASDDKTGEELKEFLCAFLILAKGIAQLPFPYYVWHRAKRIIYEQALIECGYFVHQPVIWVKPSFVIGRLHYHPRCEWALHGWIQGEGKCPFYGKHNQSDVWELGRENDGLHPTQKPVALFEIPIKNHTHLEDICYDPFGGSGSTLIACEKLGRKCRMMEIDEHYCDVIIQRWQNFTGKQAAKLWVTK